MRPARAAAECGSGCSTADSPNRPASRCAASIAPTSPRSSLSVPQACSRNAPRAAVSRASAAWKTSVMCRQRSGVMALVAPELLEQPRASGLPIALGGRDRDAEDLAGLFERQTAEESESRASRHLRGSNAESRESAASRSSTSTSTGGVARWASSSVTRAHRPDRFAMRRARARSTSRRRIIWEATPKNCARFCQTARF